MDEEEEIDDDMQENEDFNRDAFNDDTFGDGNDGLAFGGGAGGGGLGGVPIGVAELEAAERAQQFLRERAALEQERSAAARARAPAPRAGGGSSYLRVSGVPRAVGEEQVRLLLGYFGGLASFSLAPDPSGAPTDVAIVSYAEPSAEAAAVERLHGMALAGGTLAVSVARGDAMGSLSAGAARMPETPEGALDVASIEASMRAPRAAPAQPADALDVSALEAALLASAATVGAPPARALPPQPPAPLARAPAPQPQPQPMPAQPPLPAGLPPVDAFALLRQRLPQPPPQPQQPPAAQPPLPPADGGAASVAQLAEAERSIAGALRQLALEAQQREGATAGLRAQLALLPVMRAQPGADARALAEAEQSLAAAVNAAGAQAHAAQQRALAARAELDAVQRLLRAQLGASDGRLPPAQPPLPAQPRLPAAAAGPPSAAAVASPYGPGGAPAWASLLPNMPPLPPSARVGKRMTLAELEMIVR